MIRTDNQYYGIDENISKACYAATRDFLAVRNSSIEYEDTLQEAFLIALAPRGRKQARTSTEYYYKVYYGLIDKYRSETHSRVLKRNNLTHIKYISYYAEDDTVTSEVENAYYSSWQNSSRETIYTCKDKNKSVFKISSSVLQDNVQDLLSMFSEHDRVIITRFMEGESGASIARSSSMSYYAVSKVLKTIKRLLKCRLLLAI